MGKRSDLDAALLELSAGGAAVAEIERGRHLKIRWSAFGVPMTTIVARTASDCRAEDNTRCRVRRQLREAAAHGARTALVSAQAAHVRACALQVRAPSGDGGEGKGKEWNWKGRDSASRVGKELDSLVGSRR